MDTKALIEKLNQIEPEGRTRMLYEVVAWAERDNFPRKIMDPAIRPIRTDMTVCGPAYTVADSYMTFSMLDDVRKKGCVIVVQSSGCPGTFIGNFMRELATRAGALGIVTDGYVTHLGHLIKNDLPIFAKGSRIPYAGYKMKGTVQVPITCGGVVVNPGDIIVGNLDGVMVLTPAEAETLAERSEWFTKITDTIVEKYMDKGIRYTQVPGVREYWQHKSSGTKDEAEIYKEWIEKYGR